MQVCAGCVCVCVCLCLYVRMPLIVGVDVCMSELVQEHESERVCLKEAAAAAVGGETKSLE